jgi:hypothetical protein
MRKTLLVLAATAAALSPAAPATAANAAVSVKECRVSYTGQIDYDLRTCSLISIGTFGTFSISGASAWGQVDCVVGGSSGTNYGGLRSFRTVPGDLCTLHVYTSGYNYASGHAWTFN